MTALDLTRLKALAQAATPGPWEQAGVVAQTAGEDTVAATRHPGMMRAFPIAAARRNAAFIAAANPAAVLALIARLERAEQDANRWRGFIGSARIKPQGSAGLTSDTDPYGNPWNGYAHMGLEIWSTFPASDDPQLQERIDGATKIGRDWLIKYADVAIAALAARAPMPNDPLDDVLPLPAETNAIVDHLRDVKQEIADHISGSRQPLPLNLPASLDLDGKEGGNG